MGVGSLGIAVLPGYAQIGALAPVLLVAARLLQGLSLGGEYGTSATYLSEVATPHRRGFYSSFQYVTLTSGQLLALGVQIVLQQLLTRSRCMPGAGGSRSSSGRRRRDRHVAAAHDGRVGELQARRQGEHRTRQLAGPARLSAGVPDRGGSDPRRHHRVLHVHHVHAEVHDQHGRPAEGAGDVDQLRRPGSSSSAFSRRLVRCRIGSAADPCSSRSGSAQRCALSRCSPRCLGPIRRCPRSA